MNILLLSHELCDFGGGAGNAAELVAREFVKCGHRVSCITSNNGALPAREERSGITIYRVPGWRKNALENRRIPTFLSYLFHAPRCARRMMPDEEFEIILAYFTIPAGLAGLRIRRQGRAKLVVSLRGGDVPGFNSQSRIMKCLRPLTRKIWRDADHVIALSQGLLDYATGISPLPGASVIHNGVDARSLRKPATEAAEGSLRFITVGRLVPFKAIEVMIDALRLARTEYDVDAVLEIVGDGPCRGALESQVLDANLEQFVTFSGYVPRTELPGHYHRADVFITTARSEAFGQVITEAMAASLPVLGVEAGGIPEFVHHGENGWLVPADNVLRLSEAFREVADLDRTALRQIGERNQQYMETDYSWSKRAGEHLELFECLLEGELSCVE